MFLRHLRYVLLFVCSFYAVCAEQVYEQTDVLPLEAAIDQALAHNLGLITARYRPANAQDDVIIEEAAFDPELFGSVSMRERQAAASGSSLDSTSVPESEDRTARVGVDKRLSTGATVTVDSNINRSSSNNNAARNPDYSTDVGLSLRQPLLKDAWSRVNLAPLARAKATASQSVFQLRSDVLDVMAETEIAYWNLAYAKASRALIVSSLELAENLLEENRERERLGLVTPLEVLQSETELLNQQEAIIQAERAIEDAEDALRRVMGNASFLDSLEGDITVFGIPQKLPELRPIAAVVSDTILSDADAMAQERAIEVARINALLARDETRPDLDATAGVDYLGRDDEGRSAYRGAYNADGYSWNVGLELRFPWGFRDARAQVRQAERNFERETVELYDLKQQKALAARNAWRAVHSGQKRIEVTRKALALNEESFEQERARYGSGLTAYRQVLEAQRDFDSARGNFLSAQIETLRAIVRLSRVDSTILQRNGFTWDKVDALSEAPNLNDHPLLEEIDI
jgi:outer membrane protein TolC